jgi:small-conductance mechanosensitive channel
MTLQQLWSLGSLCLLLILAWASRRAYLALRARALGLAQRLPDAHALLSGLSPQRLSRRLVPALRWAHLAWQLGLAYLAVSATLGAFASTRPLAQGLLSNLLDPLLAAWRAFLAYIPRLLFVVVGASLIYAAIKAARLFFDQLGSGRLDAPDFRAEWAEPTYKIARFLILVFGLVVLAPYLPGAKSPAFQGVSVFLGVIISLSSSSAIGNIVSGVILIYAGNLRVGDRVRINDSAGVIIERTLLVTRLRTPKNVVVTLPNALVLGGKVENDSLAGGEAPLLIHTTVTIGYDAPWRQVHGLLLEAARGVEGLGAEPPPFVLQRSLDDFYVSYQLNVASLQPQWQERQLSDLHARIQDAFNAAGVEILSPHHRAQRDGSPRGRAQA